MRIAKNPLFIALVIGILALAFVVILWTRSDHVKDVQTNQSPVTKVAATAPASLPPTTSAPSLVKVQAPARIDRINNQYIPPQFKDYFYNTLQAVLRQKESMVGVAAPGPTQRWLDTNTQIISNGAIVKISDARNGNEQILPDPSQIEAKQNVVSYYDLHGLNHWAAGDPIWFGPSHANYQPGDSIVYDPDHVLTGTPPTGGFFGKKNGLNFYDPDHPATTPSTPSPPSTTLSWNSHDIIWADTTKFQEDFANFYTDLTTVIARYHNPKQPGSGAAAMLNVGSILALINAPEIKPDGVTISVAASTRDRNNAPVPVSIVNGSNLTQYDVHPGDWITLSGNWYQVSGVTDTQLTIAGGYIGPGDHSPLEIRNWLLIPQATDTATPPLQQQIGTPTAESAIFREQFEQLHDVLAALTSPTRTYPGRQ